MIENNINLNRNNNITVLNKKEKNKKSIKIKKFNTLSRKRRKNSAPLHLINEFQEFKYSSQYNNLLKAYTNANILIILKEKIVLIQIVLLEFELAKNF